jgi:hypothetical protein
MPKKLNTLRRQGGHEDVGEVHPGIILVRGVTQVAGEALVGAHMAGSTGLHQVFRCGHGGRIVGFQHIMGAMAVRNTWPIQNTLS